MKEVKKKRRPRIAWLKVRDHTRLLAKKLRREVTPKDVERDGRHPDSPYYGLLERDPQRGLERYRLWQATQILGRLKVIYHDQLGNEIKVREYVRLVHEAPATHELRAGYFPRQKAMTNSVLEQQCVERAITELESWQTRWRGFRRIEASYSGVQMTLSQLRRLKARVLKKVR